MFDQFKNYINNSDFICDILQRILKNSSFLIRRMTSVTKDVPLDILELATEE